MQANIEKQAITEKASHLVGLKILAWAIFIALGSALIIFFLNKEEN